MKKYGKYEKRPEGVPAPAPKQSKKMKNALLQTYITSLLCMVLCVTMFFGTSFAWFTSEVTNRGNEIYIGTLDVELAKKTEDAAGNETWDSLSSTNADGTNTTKLFDGNIRWEPGYTALETIKVTNQGDLAFKYVLNFIEEVPNGGTSLAEIGKFFDVWVYDHSNTNGVSNPTDYSQITEANGWKNVGTLDKLLSGEAVLTGTMDKDAVRKAGQEKANTGTTDGFAAEHTYTIALHMNEHATDEVKDDGTHTLMGKQIMLNVKLVAYQMESEKDAFDTTYDDFAELTQIVQRQVKFNKYSDTEVTIKNYGEVVLNAAYQFQPDISLKEVQDTDPQYRYWHADFVVSADAMVPKNSVALAGYYEAFCGENGPWIALSSDVDIAAEQEIRLLETMNVSINYEEICNYGNDGTGFLCGIYDLSKVNANAGTTITVELRLYETEKPSAENGNSTNVETGRYIVLGTYTYTFPSAGTSSGNTN